MRERIRVGELMNGLGGGSMHESLMVRRTESCCGKHGHSTAAICVAEDEIQIGRIEIDVSDAELPLNFWLLHSRKHVEQQ